MKKRACHRGTGGRLLRLSALGLGLVLAVPGAAQASVGPLAASLESGTLSEFSQFGQSNGTLTVDSSTSYDGSRSAKAHFNGGAVNGYTRGIWDVQWNEGETLWYSSAFFLPVGFKAAMQGEVSLMRWDNWPTYQGTGDVSGIVIWGGDKKARLKLGTYSGATEQVLVGPFDLPEGRWFHLEVHQLLSKVDGTARSQVFLDDALVGSSTQPNSTGRAIERMRYGIVAIDASKQYNPLTLWFDRARVSTTKVGSLGTVSPAPTTEPAPVSPAPTTEPVPVNSAPVVTITSPATGSTFQNVLAVTASATDDTGVTKVEAYFDGKLIGTDVSAPYSWSHNVSKRTKLGTHTLSVRAYDVTGASSTAQVSISRVR